MLQTSNGSDRGRHDDPVSVVLPVHYVDFEWLERSIRSVLEQDYPEIELIVVDDEATENIEPLVSRLGVTKYLKNPRNLQLPASLNRGFAAADGDFHTWTSADNYMLPGMISTLVRALHDNPSASIVCGPSVTVDADGNTVESRGEERAARLSGTSLDDKFVKRKYVFYSTLGACFMYTREVTDRLDGYDESLHGAEDYDFWVRASRYFKILRLSQDVEPLYAYRVHEDSISANVPYCYSKMRAEVLRRELNIQPNEDLREAYQHYLQRFRSERFRRLLHLSAFRKIAEYGSQLLQRLKGAVFGSHTCS